MAFLYLSYSGTVVCTLIDWQADIKTILMGLLTVCTTLSILLIVLYIFKHPLVLYGLPELSPALSITPTLINSDLPKQEVKLEEPKATLEDNFDWDAFNTQIRIDAHYTKTGITLQEIAKQYNMSTRTLSFIINHFTNDNFQNYMNVLRIGFVLEQFNKGAHQNKTLESIGAEAGFGSKSAFFYSFKRCTGKTPKEYIVQNNL
jgi:AraC-like DNA-binding protein